jgi:hypothetical protein
VSQKKGVPIMSRVDAVKNLAGNNTVEVEFKTWKNINLGTGLKSADDFLKALAAKNCNIGNLAREILGKPDFAASIAFQETEFELIKVSDAELGLKNGVNTRRIYNRAQKLGLSLCPAEVGPQLRLQYLDQPNGESVFIAMEPIADSDGDLSVFSVRRDDGGLWLSSGCGEPDDFWSAGRQWVFLRRKY